MLTSHVCHFPKTRLGFYSSCKSKETENFPLHSAVEEGNVEKVARILKTEIIPVNSKNNKGEWPLYIAAKKWHRNKNYPIKILRLLQEYGACYMYDSDTKDAALKFIANTDYSYSKEIEIEKWKVSLESTRQCIEGCGFAIKGCTNGCVDESKRYSREFKAKIAYESLSTELSLEELAKKHGTYSWEIVKWRRQVRENLISLIDEQKS